MRQRFGIVVLFAMVAVAAFDGRAAADLSSTATPQVADYLPPSSAEPLNSTPSECSTPEPLQLALPCDDPRSWEPRQWFVLAFFASMIAMTIYFTSGGLGTIMP